MRKTLCGMAALMLLSTTTQAASKDDPILAKVMINQLEVRSTDGPDPRVLEAQAWIGQDLNKLWLKADVEYVDGSTEEAEIQALYSRAIAPYWDFQVGWRHDSRPKPNRDWLAIGFEGLAPYWFEIDAAAFIGESGQVGARLEAEYELMFTQRWVLSPELKVNLHTKNDEATGTGSGLSDTELGLRLRYEITRQFAPYIGFEREWSYGETADLRALTSHGRTDNRWVVGLRLWF